MWKIFLAPLVGAAIGYLTNWLAIRMLFLPYGEKRLFGRRLPFSPGLIPRERDVLAGSIGRIVSRELINEETITANLNRPGVRQRIGRMIDERIKKLPRFMRPFVVAEIRLIIEDALMTLLIRETPNIVRGLDVNYIVEDQIKKFPLPRLEELLLEVSGKHLRSITIFGGVLGFVIGLLQLPFIL